MNGVRVRFLDLDKALERLKSLAQDLIASRSDVLEVSLFGSLVRGNYAPGSDADIYILLKKDTRKITDRIPEFLDHFSGIGVAVEVFPYTVAEIAQMADVNFIRTLQKEKIVLISRERASPVP
jgi:predicted nucleotidyltransferase